MSYENPTTVVDTESAKIRAAGMASFGQSIGGAITALGQRQREEAKETKKANKAFLNSQTKYNEEYQKYSWLATDEYKEDAGFDISPQVTVVFNKWANEGARLKAERDRSDDPAVRAKLDSQIAVYDKFFLGGGMTSNLESFAELQKTIQTEGAPGTAGNVGGLSLSSTDSVLYKNFMGLGRGNGGKALKITGMGGQIEEDGQYSPLSLFATFDGKDEYNMSDLNNDLITIPDMQNGTVDVLEKEGYLSGNKLNFNSQGFKNFIKTNENGKVEYTVGYDAKGNEKRYQKLDFNIMYDSLNPTYQASIVGYTKEGSVTDGDSSLGLRTMQSYIDDELEEMSKADKEIFKEHVGVYPEEITLEIGNAQKTLLTEESLEVYKKALTAQKLIELQKKMPGEDYSPKSSTRKGTEKERTQATQRDYLNQVTNSFAQGNTINDLYDSVINNPTSYNFTGDYAGGLIKGNDFIKEIENYDLKEMLDLNILPKNSSPKDRKEYIENAKNSLKASPNALIDFTIDSKSGASSSFGKILGEEKALIKLLLEIPAFAALEPMELQAKAKEMLKRRTKEGRNKKEINPFPQPFKPGTGGLQDLPSTS